MAGESGPWQTRVSFAPDGSFAYRPGQLLVREVEYLKALEVLYELERQTMQPGPNSEGYDKDPREFLIGKFGSSDDEPVRFSAKSSFRRLTGIPDTLEAIRKLNQAGIYAQPNHVLFAHGGPGGSGEGFQANPFYANPFYANPFYANPFYANPFYANPFYANPFYANPNPALHLSFRETGRRPSSARPAQSRTLTDPGEKNGPSVAILDTGLGRPDQVPGFGFLGVEESVDPDVPDSDSDGKGYLDPVAGHGTFIAGIIRQLAPSCNITVHKVLESYGDSDEVKVTEKLLELVDDRPDFVNLSFGGYSTTGMAALAEAITALHYADATIVASAGNDATSVPMYPAALPHVLAVGALDHEGNPAPFTNYGPWVRACTLGVEIESTFFDFDGRHPEQAKTDIDKFSGWAVWSGTSFAAPRVVAALAQYKVASIKTSHEAVRDVIDKADLERIPLLGKVIRDWNTADLGQAYLSATPAMRALLDCLASQPGVQFTVEEIVACANRRTDGGIETECIKEALEGFAEDWGAYPLRLEQVKKQKEGKKFETTYALRQAFGAVVEIRGGEIEMQDKPDEDQDEPDKNTEIKALDAT